MKDSDFEILVREPAKARAMRAAMSGALQTFATCLDPYPAGGARAVSIRGCPQSHLFGCPPPIIGDLSHGTFTNSETAGRWFAQHTLTPWIRKIETEFTRSIFSEATRETHELELELDLSGFLRGDPETRWKSHEIAVKNRVLTPNEVRLVEGWNPRAGGDDFPPAPGSAKEARGDA